MSRFWSIPLSFLVLFQLVLVARVSDAYFLTAFDTLTTQRMDPIVNPGAVSGHVHSVLGGSNFDFNTTTAKLRQSACTTAPIAEDKSNYWYPQLYFQWKNGSFTSVTGNAVVYYLFDKTPGKTTAFPDDLRMISGNPTLRSYDNSSHAQQAITFLCLDFEGTPTRHNELPKTTCRSGVRSQVNFPSCWDGKNTDSVDHKSHVAFLSGGPDTGSCSDPNFPVAIPRIFLEVYWVTQDFDQHRGEAMDASQPFVFSYGDATGYGNHADFLMGWDDGILQKVVDECNCNDFGDPRCCADAGIFTLRKGASTQKCNLSKAVDEEVKGTLPKLPGKNPVQPASSLAAKMNPDPSPPKMLTPVCGFIGDVPPAGCGVNSSSPPASSSTSGSSTSNGTTNPASSSAPAPAPPLSSPSSAPVDPNTIDDEQFTSGSPASTATVVPRDCVQTETNTSPSIPRGSGSSAGYTFERRFRLRRHPMKRRALSRMEQ